jgi:hypothetical protein
MTGTLQIHHLIPQLCKCLQITQTVDVTLRVSVSRDRKSHVNMSTEVKLKMTSLLLFAVCGRPVDSRLCSPKSCAEPRPQVHLR